MTSPEQTVLVDMDGVLADFNGKLMSILQIEHPEIPLPDPQTEFYLYDELHPTHKPAVKETISRPGFFLDLGLINGAIEGWAKLLDWGYQPRICSAPLRKNPTSVEDKQSWLEEHFAPRFGAEVIDLAIFDKQKWLHPGIALIDDRPDPNAKNHDNAPYTWEHVLFDQPYNQQVNNAPHRMLGWGDALLPEILKQIAQNTNS